MTNSTLIYLPYSGDRLVLLYDDEELEESDPEEVELPKIKEQTP